MFFIAFFSVILTSMTVLSRIIFFVVFSLPHIAIPVTFCYHMVTSLIYQVISRVFLARFVVSQKYTLLKILIFTLWQWWMFP